MPRCPCAPMMKPASMSQPDEWPIAATLRAAASAGAPAASAAARRCSDAKLCPSVKSRNNAAPIACVRVCAASIRRSAAVVHPGVSAEQSAREKHRAHEVVARRREARPEAQQRQRRRVRRVGIVVVDRMRQRRHARRRRSRSGTRRRLPRGIAAKPCGSADVQQLRMRARMLPSRSVRAASRSSASGARRHGTIVSMHIRSAHAIRGVGSTTARGCMATSPTPIQIGFAARRAR